MSESALRQLAQWASALTLEQVPRRVRDAAVNQVLSTLGAVFSGWSSDLGAPLAQAFPSPGDGPSTIIPSGVRAPASHAAMLMASWSMVLDFDDVMLGGHTGHSSVLVPLALAEGRTGEELLLAQIVANEVAARINMVCAVGSTRGQMATHLHLLAAAAARAKLEGLSAEQFSQALAFALSYPAQALFPSFLGSDAKVMCAGWPVRMGMEAVDAVRAGLAAQENLLDDPRGFFAINARVPVRDFLGGLGERWHTETNSYKIYPVCGYLCSALDATLALVREENVSADDALSVEVSGSVFTVGMDAHSAPYLDGARSRIATLTFSTPFVIASAILAREFTPAQLKRSWIEEPRVWGLASRVRSVHDVALTVEALQADIPIGAALRRVGPLQAAGFAWHLAGQAFGRAGRIRRLRETLRLVRALAASAGETGAMEFQLSTKPLGARVAIRVRDGRLLTRAVSIPRGFAGNPENARALMREKFLRCAGAVIGEGRAEEVVVKVETLEWLTAGGVADLLASLRFGGR
ncbi:MAG TPA: MmgE/PrpD family protein [Thermoanaerobaculia bacterium]|nr:MmgE/PrpD family protein [Thermoanaerobaculia bacterium]